MPGDQPFVVRGDFPAQPGDVDIYGSVGYFRLVRPNFAAQLLAREQRVGMLQEEEEYLVFFLGQRDRCVSDIHALFGWIEAQCVVLQDAGRVFHGIIVGLAVQDGAAVEHCFDAGDDFFDRERLGDVVVGSQGESRQFVGFRVLGGQEDDGAVFDGFHFP